MHLLIFVLLALIFYAPAVRGAEYHLLGSFNVAVREPSGLAYDPKNDSLWTVQDNGGDLYEIDKKGNVLKRVPLRPPLVQFRFPSLARRGDILRKALLRSGDWEGVYYKSDTDTLLLSDERTRQVIEVDRTGKPLKTIKVPIEWHYLDINHGTEGVAYDAKTKTIFVANEKNPRRVMELKEDGSVVSAFDVKVRKAEHLSDLYYDTTSDRLLVLARTMILEYTRKGKLLKTFPIEAIKAEGMTKDNKGYLYIIDESTSILYIYAPEVIPTSSRQ